MKPTVAALFVLVLCGLAAPAVLAQGQEPTNSECPVMEGTPVTESLFLDYRGVRVWFCCESCVAEFRANPEAYVQNLPKDVRERMTSVQAWAEAGGWKEEVQHPLGELHPVAVHFPVALTAVAAIAAILGLFIARSFFRSAATFTIVFGALGAVASFFTGGEAEQARGVLPDALRERVEAHEQFGMIAMYVVIVAAAIQLVSMSPTLSKKPWFRWVAFLGILAAAAVAGYAGYLGGEVVHGPDHLKHVLPF